MALLPCFLFSETGFNEAAWQDQVAAFDSAAVFAPHRDSAGLFFNPWMRNEDKGFSSLVRWWLSRGTPYSHEEKTYLPQVRANALMNVSLTQGDFILWVGHATFLLRINGEYWLTDPIFSDRAVVPKRKTPAAISLAQAGRIPCPLHVLISHNHHDHLDLNSIEALPDSADYFVPLGLGEYLKKKSGRLAVKEMDWWQSIDCGKDVTLVCLPAQHWSKRLGQGSRESLWASYLLMTPKGAIYFGGDTGYFKGFREIGRRYPGIRYALLPIGAYHPRWFMHVSHMNVQEALQAAKDLGANWFVPMHWGAFQLGDEPVGYPYFDLKRNMRCDDKVLILEPGQLQTID